MSPEGRAVPDYGAPFNFFATFFLPALQARPPAGRRCIICRHPSTHCHFERSEESLFGCNRRGILRSAQNDIKRRARLRWARLRRARLKKMPTGSGCALFPLPHHLILAVGCRMNMPTAAINLPCDGCGLPASPEHIADRVRRLELSTRFRPIHIGILFVALAPPARPEDEFYAPAESKEFFGPFLNALEIPATAERAGPAASENAPDTARLMEFQHRGHYLAYVSECPLPENHEPASATIARMGPTLIRRIRFNYRPRLVAPVGKEMLPLVEMLKGGELGSIQTLDQGLVLPTAGTGGREWATLFQRAVASVAPR
jgi:hypothetical protein